VGDYTPIYEPGTTRTATTSAVVTGGQLLEVSGDGTVAGAAAGSTKVVGVAAHDAASGARVTVIALGGVVHELTAGTGGITAGARVKVGASSNLVVAWVSGTDSESLIVGVALTTATATNKVKVLGQ
jgi:Uncharacterized conserved protein (DUF2190)